MKPTHWFIIINPKAANGFALKQWPIIKKQLKVTLFNFEFAFTQHVGHATSLTLNAVNKGFRNIICVGGDGTIHEVINGLMLQKVTVSSPINLGVIPIGTGNDWAKNYNIPHDHNSAINLIKNNNIKIQDIGEIEFLDSKKPSIYFNNLAGIGFDGLVAKKTEKLKYLGKLSYLVAACHALLTFRNFNVEIVSNNSRFKTRSLMVLIGICSYSGGGMRLTSNPNPQDGLFDVTNVINFTIWDFIINLPKLYNGKVETAKKVKTFKTDNILILSNKRKRDIYIQADGEVIPAENIKITLHKKALSFYS